MLFLREMQRPEDLPQGVFGFTGMTPFQLRVVLLQELPNQQAQEVLP